jgi:hypothetical protein
MYHTGSYSEPIQNSADNLNTFPSDAIWQVQHRLLLVVLPSGSSHNIFPLNLQVIFFCFPHTNLHDTAVLTTTTTETWHSSLFNSTCFRHSSSNRFFLENAQLSFVSPCLVSLPNKQEWITYSRLKYKYPIQALLKILHTSLSSMFLFISDTNILCSLYL